MKKIILIMTGNAYLNPNVLVEGKLIEYKKNKKNQKVYTIETEKDEVNIEISKWDELEGKWGLFIAIIFFIVSLFGLFDIKQKNRWHTVKYKGKIKVDKEVENPQLVLIMNGFKVNEKAFFYEGNCQIEDNESNRYLINEEIKHKEKIMKRVKRFTWIGILISLMIIFILKLI